MEFISWVISLLPTLRELFSGMGQAEAAKVIKSQVSEMRKNQQIRDAQIEIRFR